MEQHLKVRTIFQFCKGGIRPIDAGRNCSGIVLNRAIAASGSWSSAHALAASKPRIPRAEASDHFCAIELCADFLSCFAPLRAFPYAGRSASRGWVATSSRIERCRSGKVFVEHGACCVRFSESAVQGGLMGVGDCELSEAECLLDDFAREIAV